MWLFRCLRPNHQSHVCNLRRRRYARCRQIPFVVWLAAWLAAHIPVWLNRRRCPAQTVGYIRPRRRHGNRIRLPRISGHQWCPDNHLPVSRTTQRQQQWSSVSCIVFFCTNKRYDWIRLYIQLRKEIFLTAKINMYKHLSTIDNREIKFNLEKYSRNHKLNKSPWFMALHCNAICSNLFCNSKTRNKLRYFLFIFGSQDKWIKRDLFSTNWLCFTCIYVFLFRV